MNKTLTAVVLILFVIIQTSCTKKLTEVRLVPEKPEFKMLIAGDSSEFKDRIRNRIIGQYKDYLDIHVVNIKSLKTTVAHDYDVVLIMDTCLAWSRFNPSIKTFMKNSDNRKKTVLFMTADDIDWEYSYKEVDAITSASVIENEEQVLSRITYQIDGIIKR